MNLTDLLLSCPVLYPSTKDGEGNILVTDDQDNDYSVGVTLDYLPEDHKWVASYSDFIESTPTSDPKAAVVDLQNKLKVRGLM